MNDKNNERNEIWREVITYLPKIFAIGMAMMAVSLGSVYLFTGCRTSSEFSETNTSRKEALTTSGRNACLEETANDSEKHGSLSSESASASENISSRSEHTRIIIQRDSAGRPTEIVKERQSNGKVTAQRHTATTAKDTVSKMSLSLSEKSSSQSATAESTAKSKSEEIDRQYDGGYRTPTIVIIAFVILVAAALYITDKKKDIRQ